MEFSGSELSLSGVSPAGIFLGMGDSPSGAFVAGEFPWGRIFRGKCSQGSEVGEFFGGSFPRAVSDVSEGKCFSSSENLSTSETACNLCGFEAISLPEV